MGAKVQIDNYMQGHYSMRDITRESNGTSWPPCYGSLSRPFGNLYPEYHKDGMKQTMLEHEATFKNQVYELHRLYQVQRDLMDEVRCKEQFSRQLPYEASSSSSPVPYQMQSEDVQRLNGSSLPLANFMCNRPSVLGPQFTKGKSIQAGPSPIQNIQSPRNSEVSESRPTKCRRKMLDLQLPANEYVDESDEVSDNTFFSPDKKGKLGSDYGRTKVLADLNEPIYVEETTDVSCVDFLGHAGSQHNLQRDDLSKRFFGSSKDVSQQGRSLNGTLSNLSFDNRPHNQDRFNYTLKSEQPKGSSRTMNQGSHEQKRTIPSQPVQVSLEQGCQPRAFLTRDHWKPKYGGIEKFGRSYDQIRSSHIPNHQPTFLHHSDFGKSSDQCASSWGKPSGILDQRFIQSQTTPFLCSSQSNDSFGKKWNLNNTPFGGDPSLRNGFFQTSSTSFREVTPVCFTPPRFDHTNCNYNNSGAKKPVRDVNLNVAPPNGLSSDDIDQAAFPWVNPEVEISRKGSNALESSQKIPGVSIFESISIVKKEDSVIASPPSVDHRRPGKIALETSTRKVLFDMNLPCEPEPLDSETPIEEIVIVEKEIQINSGTVVNHFDLNSCITEEEAPCGTRIDLEAPVMIESDEEKEPEKHLEGEVDHLEPELARSAAEAIIAMSSLSSSVNPNPSNDGDAELEDALNWFVGIVCRRYLENEGSPRVWDDFESMTLNLKECSFEEYFPKPSFPEIPNIEETSGGYSLATRTRKGQPRRGRQKRDFQRDILPGLTLLSRNEVTEDLQTFGGLMRATGHPWHSGPNRTRNGSTRGRRRSTVAAARTPVNTEFSPPLTKEHASKVEVGVEDRSLTSWGKTTRRPRRQRYPTGNPPLPVPLS